MVVTGSTTKPNGKSGKSPSPPVLAGGGFAPSLMHPRQRVQTRKVRQRQRARGGTRRNPHNALPTQHISTAIKTLEKHVPVTSSVAQEALDAVYSALDDLEQQLAPPETLIAQHKLIVSDPTPPHLCLRPFPDHHLRLYRSTYEANDPSEDRSTVVIGDDFLFAGVWDGHGGWQCSEYTQNVVFENFVHAYEDSQGGGVDLPRAFHKTFQKTNRDYYHFARSQNVKEAFFAGTCAVAVFIDLIQQKLWCANLGDSRAVMGVFRQGGKHPDDKLQTIPLSVDHTASNLIERQTLHALHPNDKEVVLDVTQLYEDDEDDDSFEEPPDWRVKKLAAFTRSIGDLHLKEKNTSALFNSYMDSSYHILPRPGTINKQGQKVLPYISTDPEIKEFPIKEAGFVIVACDGVWDEMSSEEAVECVAELIDEHNQNGDDDANVVNIADLFIEMVLERAVERLRENDPYEADLTLEELKRRPKGKGTDGSRSLLHDDITVVIIQLGTTEESNVQSAVQFHQSFRRNSLLGASGVAPENRRSSLRSSSRSVIDPMKSLEDILKATADDPERSAKDKQIVDMMEFFDGMNARHLEILFNALDVDGNGMLDRREVGRLINQVMLTNVSPDVVDLAFGEMDGDGSGAIDFDEFVAFFGRNRNEEEK